MRKACLLVLGKSVLTSKYQAQYTMTISNSISVKNAFNFQLPSNYIFNYHDFQVVTTLLTVILVILIILHELKNVINIVCK
jgi:hypothetical protein